MRFATDATLGKLGRQLRAAGFDTLCQHQSGVVTFLVRLTVQRIILTRTTAVRNELSAPSTGIYPGQRPACSR
jgi:uncharacterized protein with PIN domain